MHPLVGDVNSREGYTCVGAEVYGKSLHLSLNLAVNSKLQKIVLTSKDTYTDNHKAQVSILTNIIPILHDVAMSQPPFSPK